MRYDITFIVDGKEFKDTEHWGKGWKEAKKASAELQKPIFKHLIDNLTNFEETYFFAKGCFLAERFFAEDKVYIFSKDEI